MSTSKGFSASDPTPLPRLTLYSKPNCHLCDEAADEIALARKEASFDYVEINILSDPVLYEQYKHAIPVISLNGTELFRYRLTASALLDRLRTVDFKIEE